MRVRSWFRCLLLVVASACVASGGDQQPTNTASEQPTTVGEVTTSSTTPLTPPPGIDVLVATTADELDELAVALNAAADQWESAAPDMYAYRVRVECECADRGATWVRVFDPDWHEEVPWDVEALHSRINAAIDRSPGRVEIGFDPVLGLPVWLSVDGSDSEAILVDEFHEITFTSTPHDGLWRFVGGEVDDTQFGNPKTGLIIASLRNGTMTFPIDCNEAFGAIDVHKSYFGIGAVGVTAAGCMEYSEESELFSGAVQTATTIERVGPQLVISGERSVLRLVPLERPEQRGELGLTAAGETLVIDADHGQPSSVFTISSGDRTWPDSHPGGFTMYLLTAVDAGSDRNPEWSQWEGEFDVPAPPSGPQQIVIPDNIGVGDYQLCSPYWSGDFFCYDLPVRPASAPWYVTAGADGVVLQDADGTSKSVWEGEARIAFWFDDLLLVESETGIVAIRDSDRALAVADAGSRLMDAARIEGSVKALIVRDGHTVLIDIDRGDETVLGPAAIEGRLAGDLVVLRTAPDVVEARSSDGSVIWELGIDPEEMITAVTASELRLDLGHLYTEGPEPPFWHNLETRVVDSSTGQVVDEFRTELAIPLEGDEVTEPCTRAELRDGLLLCPQADGRLTTIEVDGGDQRSIIDLADVMATFVR